MMPSAVAQDALRGNRLIGAAVFAATLAPLLIAASLTPSAAGMGTHMQMGLPECGFKLNTTLPCATCGMTTAFSYAAHGQLLQSFITQPAGAVLCIMLSVGTILGGWAMFSGMPLAPLFSKMGRPLFFFSFIGFILASWGYTLCVQCLG